MKKSDKIVLIVWFAILTIAIFYVTNSIYPFDVEDRLDSYYLTKMLIICILFSANLIADAIILHIPTKKNSVEGQEGKAKEFNQ